MDSELAVLLRKHLSLAVPALDLQSTRTNNQGGRATARKQSAARQSGLDLADFVERCGEQLAHEEAEEVAQAELELGSYSTAGAQVH